MVLIRTNLYLFLFLLVPILIQGCQKAPAFEPDFSTPEATMQTHFYASKYNMPELLLDTFSEEVKLKFYGPDYEAQLKTAKRDSGKGRIGKKSTMEVTKVVPSTHNDDRVKVSYRQYKNGTHLIGGSEISMVLEDGKWKIALDEEEPRTPEEIAEWKAMKSWERELLTRPMVVDEEKGIITLLDPDTRESNMANVTGTKEGDRT